MLCCNRKNVECSPPSACDADKGNDSVSEAGEFSADGVGDVLGHIECDCNQVICANYEMYGQLTNTDNKYKYDFIIIYNHARSHLCVTDDTKLSLDFANEASRVLEKSGYRGYNPSNADKYGRTYIERLCQVLPTCHKTIVVFTPEFVRNVLPWYLAMPCLSCHILRGGDVDKSRTLIVFLSLDSSSQYWLPSEINLDELHAVHFAQNDTLRAIEWKTFLAAFTRHSAQSPRMGNINNSDVNTRVGLEESVDHEGTLTSVGGQSIKVKPGPSTYVNMHEFDAELRTSNLATPTTKEHGDYDRNNNQLFSSADMSEGSLLEQIPELVPKDGSRSLGSSDINSSLDCLSNHARRSSLPLDDHLSQESPTCNEYSSISRLDSPNKQLDLTARHRLQILDAIVTQAKSPENMAKYTALGNIDNDCDLYQDLYPNILLSQMRGEHRDDVCSEQIFSSSDNRPSSSPKTIQIHDEEGAQYLHGHDDDDYDSDDHFMLLPNSKNINCSGSVNTVQSSYSGHFADPTSPLSIKSEPIYHPEDHSYSSDLFITQSNYPLCEYRTDSYLLSPDHSIPADISDSDFSYSATHGYTCAQSETSRSQSDHGHSFASLSPVSRYSSYIGVSARSSASAPYLSMERMLGRRYSFNSDDGYSTSRSKPSSVSGRRANYEYPSYGNHSDPGKNIHSASLEYLRNVRNHSSSSSLRDGSRFIFNRPSRFKPKSDVSSYTSSYYKPTTVSRDYVLTTPRVAKSIPDIKRQSTFHRPMLVNDHLASVHRPPVRSSLSYDTYITRQRVSSPLKTYSIRSKYNTPSKIGKFSSNDMPLSSSTVIPNSSDVSTSFTDSTYSDMSSRLKGLLNENGKRQERLSQVLNMAETALERRREHEVNEIEEQICTLQKSLADIPGVATDEFSYRRKLETSNVESGPSSSYTSYEYHDASCGNQYTIEGQHGHEASPHMLSFGSADDSYKDAVCYLDNASRLSSPKLVDDVSESMSDSEGLYESTSFIELDMDNVDSSFLTTIRPPSSTPRIQIRSSICGCQSSSPVISETACSIHRRISDPLPMPNDGKYLDISDQATKQLSVSQPDLLDAPNPDNAIFLLQTIYNVDSNDDKDRGNKNNIGVTVAQMDTYVPDCKADTSPVSPYIMISISQANLSLADNTDDPKCEHDGHGSIADISVENTENSLLVNSPHKEINLSDYADIGRNDISIAPRNIDRLEHKCFEQADTEEEYIVPESYHKQKLDTFVPKKEIITEDSVTSICYRKPGIDLQSFTLPTNEDYIFPSLSPKQENAFSKFVPCSNVKDIDTCVLHTPPPIVCLPSVSNIDCDRTVDKSCDRFEHIADGTGECEVLHGNATLIDEDYIAPTYQQKPDINILKRDPINEDYVSVSYKMKQKPELSLEKIVCADVNDEVVIPDHIPKYKPTFNFSNQEQLMSKAYKIDNRCPQTVFDLPTFSGEQYVDRKEIVISSFPPETFRMEMKPNIVDISATMESSFEQGQSVSYATIVLHSTPKCQTSLNDSVNQISIRNKPVVRSLNLPDKVHTKHSDRRHNMTFGINNQDDVSTCTSHPIWPNELNSSTIPTETGDVCFDKYQTSNACSDISTFPAQVTCENRPNEMIVCYKDYSMSRSAVEDDSGCYSVLDADSSTFAKEMRTLSPNTFFSDNRIAAMSAEICEQDQFIDLNETLSHVDQTSNDTKNMCPTKYINESSFLRFPYEHDSGIHFETNSTKDDTCSVIDQDKYRPATSSDFQFAMSHFRDLEKVNSPNDRFVSSSLRTRLPGYKCNYFQYLNSFVGHPLNSICDQPDGERDENVDIEHENVSTAESVQITNAEVRSVDLDSRSRTTKALPRIAVQQYLARAYTNFSADCNQYSGWSSPGRLTRHQRSLSDIQVSLSPRIPVRPRPQSASCLRQPSGSQLSSLMSPPVTTDTVWRVVYHLATHPEHMYM